jgi:hypothetical protein
VFIPNGTPKLAPLGRHGEVPVTLGGKSKPDYPALSPAAINKHTTTPEFTAKYKAWLESLGPKMLAAWR